LAGVTSGCALLPGQRAPIRESLRQSAVSAPAAAATGVAPGFLPALPGYQFQFPRDHAAHPGYQTEWWYYTGHLAGRGRRFGFELTFFRVGIDPSRRASRSAWALHTLYFAHFTVTDEDRNDFHFFEKVSRPALG